MLRNRLNLCTPYALRLRTLILLLQPSVKPLLYVQSKELRIGCSHRRYVSPHLRNAGTSEYKSMPRPSTYADQDTVEDECFHIHGISERKEQLDDIRKVWKHMKFKYKNREFWCRGYYLDTVGKNTKAINEYISHQLREDELGSQLTLEEPDPFTGSK